MGTKITIATDEDEEDTKVMKPFMAKNRKCRDIIFLFLFAIFWAGMIILAFSAVKRGDPRRLVVPMDYMDNFCGFDNSNSSDSATDTTYKNRTATPYLYYFDLTSSAY